MDYFNCEACDVRTHFEESYQSITGDCRGSMTSFPNLVTGKVYTTADDCICIPCGELYNAPRLKRHIAARLKREKQTETPVVWKTDDGYKFQWVQMSPTYGQWHDFGVDETDMYFEGTINGPIDDNGDPLSGRLID